MAVPEIISVPSPFGRIQIGADPEFELLRPRKKVRGRRRYYRALQRKAAQFQVELDGWYDHHHWHVDWPGLGNLSRSERLQHLAALFVMFRRALAQTATWAQPHQCWLQIDAHDSSQDAVFLHTPNPNADNFPHGFGDLDWECPIPELLREFVAEPGWQFGRFDRPSTHFVVRPRPTA
ncbi:MAG: hypothetical protein K8T90_21370 [Planctomycetes bacterium]|nr:hypothetical protein [Planctomycetota bacterium]